MEDPVQQWGPDRIEDLVALVAAAAPGEDLSADELLTACYERAGVVIGPASGGAAVALGLRRAGDGALVADVRLMAVEPRQRRAGAGRALLGAAERWATDRGAQRIEIGGPAPFGLWSGVDPDGALAALASACGFAAGEAIRAYAVPVAFRSAPPGGVAVRRVVRDADVIAVTLHVSATWPQMSDEIARALDHGTCHVAVRVEHDGHLVPAPGDELEVVGVGSHSVTRAGWVGPLAVVPDARRRGVGSALLGQICRDLMIAELPEAHVPGIVDPDVDAFLRAVGAVVRPTRHPMAKDLRG
jgi:GNAT superfamily N-acetyltransferase